MRLAGAVVAYNVFAQDPSSETSDLQVKSLRSGKLLHRWVAGNTAPNGVDAAVTDVVLKSDGSVGWIALVTQRAFGGSYAYEVRKADRDGGAILDSSREIAFTSLTLSGSTMSWVNAGVRRSAILH